MQRQSWIFQANPERFDIDGFFAIRPVEFSWLVTRYKERAAVGDQVFIWRAAGSDDSANSGIVAETIIIGATEPRPDDSESLPFWKSHDKVGTVHDRALLRLVRVATPRERIRRDWLREDPVLRDLLILRFASGTNYELRPHEATRLNALWSKTGRDWNYAESVAGLWAYQQTYGGEVSRLPGSPVAQVAILIGRAVSGVYNKVMNFRAIDPRDMRAGMTGGGATDRHVWTDFFDPARNTLRTDDLKREFERLWDDVNGESGSDDAAARDITVEEETNRLAKLSLNELEVEYAKRARDDRRKPGTRLATTRQFERDPFVIAIAKLRANFLCEVPECSHRQFMDANGKPYCEAHHIRPLADGGEDKLDNVACLCASHHRESHHGRDAPNLRQRLMEIRFRDRKTLSD